LSEWLDRVPCNDKVCYLRASKVLVNKQKFTTMYKLIFFATFLAFFTACKENLTYEERLAKDTDKLNEYAAEKGLVTTKTASGLQYVITKVGTGGSPNLNNNVKVYYKGYTLDGEVFDETDANAPVTFPLSNLIVGWQEGIPLLKKTGKGTFLIPSGLAYGPQGSGSIGANEPLVFEIELVDFF
jgi:FKBP-type peptidyl-prolyl cis-trans isomerase FkpA